MMASHAGTFRGLPAREARGYLADFPSVSSMPTAAKSPIPLPERLRAPHLTQRRDDPSVVEDRSKGIQSGTKQFESLPSGFPESDAAASEGVLQAAAARGTGERVAKGDDVITHERLNTFLLGLLNVAVIGFGIVFWDSFTTVRDNVGALQKDITEIKVQSATTNGKLDTMAATNNGQFQLIAERLEALKPGAASQP